MSQESGHASGQTAPMPDAGAYMATGLGMETGTYRAGDEIGPYKLVSRIGEGGFGEVWTAERRHPYVEREVSKAEWRAMTGRDNGLFKGDELPVECVSWTDIDDGFVRASRGFFRMPSEAEWEYACRAGTTTARSTGPKIDHAAARCGSDSPVACGSLPANPWGFREMHGNVWEWCADAYDAYPKDGGDETALTKSADPSKVVRGGG